MESDCAASTGGEPEQRRDLHRRSPGLAADEFDIGEGIGTQIDGQISRSTMETLRTLAMETDGRAIVNRNDLDVGMKQIMRDSSAYYLLGYNSTSHRPTESSTRSRSG